MWKKFSNGPPFGSFSRVKWKSLISCQNDQCVETIIFCKLDHFWVAIRTKKTFPFPKSRFWKWGDCQNFKVIGPEEMPILVLGRRKRPQLKRDRPKTYKFWQSPHCLNLTSPFMSWPQNLSTLSKHPLHTLHTLSRHCLHTLEGLLIP